MKIAIIVPPVSGHLNRGVGSYTRNLFSHLKKCHSDHEFQLIDIHSTLDAFDGVHFPYFDPFFLTLPIFLKKPFVVTVHDCIPFRYPDAFPIGIRGQIKWRLQKFALHKSRLVITDSLSSKKDTTKYMQIPTRKIRVVYLAPAKEFTQVKDKSILFKTKRKYSLPEKFILYVGDINFNKNITGFIHSFKSISLKYPDLYFVMIGNGFVENSKQLDSFKTQLNELNILNKCILLGKITPVDLVHIYNLAKVYVQPSLAEGFGLPVLEAMACGCPVVDSNATSLIEITGNAAILVDPSDMSGFTHAVSDLIINREKQTKMIKLGIQNVSKFTWDKTVSQTLKIYEEVFSK